MSDREPRAIMLDGAAPAEAGLLAAATAGNTAGRGTYPVDVSCDNCDWSGQVDVPKGTPAPRGQRLSPGAADCPSCGCSTLTRPLMRPFRQQIQVVSAGSPTVQQRYQEALRAQQAAYEAMAQGPRGPRNPAGTLLHNERFLQLPPGTAAAHVVQPSQQAIDDLLLAQQVQRQQTVRAIVAQVEHGLGVVPDNDWPLNTNLSPNHVQNPATPTDASSPPRLGTPVRAGAQDVGFYAPTRTDAQDAAFYALQLANAGYRLATPHKPEEAS